MLNGRKATKELLKELEQGTKPKTNADKIRALDDEKLANYLMQFTDLDCRIDFCQNLPKCEALLDTEEGIPFPCARSACWAGSGSLRRNPMGEPLAGRRTDALRIRGVIF